MAEQSVEHQYQRLLQIVQRDRLLERIPHLNEMIGQMPPRPGLLRDRRIAAITTTITSYHDSLLENPFHAAPGARLQGPLLTGMQKRDGLPIGIDPVELCGNLGVIGTTGSGKTSFVEHVLTELDRVAPRVQQCLFDPKRDYPARAARHENTIIVDDDLPLNILIPPGFMAPERYHALLVKTLCAAYFGGYHLHRIITDAIRQAFTERANGPSLQHLLLVIERLGGRDATFQSRDAKLNAATRIGDLCTTFPGIARATPPHCLTMQHLCTTPVYFSSRHLLNAYEFLFALWVAVRHEYHQHAGIKNALHTIIVADEGLQIFQATTQHIGAEPLLNHTIGMTREAGLGFAITLSSIKNASPLLRANLNLQAVLRLADGVESHEIRRTFRLTPEQHDYLDHRLARGEVLLRLGHRYPEPILALFPAPSPDAKTISAQQWADAKARANALIPASAPPITVTTASPPAPVAQTIPAERIALNNNEATTLACTAEAVMPLVSEIAIRTGLHPMVIDRCRKRLEGVFKFMASGPVRTGRGKGKKGIALYVTTAGYKWLNRTPPRRMRGHSSLEHQYWCTVIAQALDGHLETTINTKSCDVIIRYDHDRHHAIIDAIINHAHRLTDEITPLTDGMMIAIEVERSAPEKTAVPNAEQNQRDAHLPLTIIAADTNLLQTYAALKEQLPTNTWPHILLIDALWLIDACRHGAGGAGVIL